MAGRKFLVVAGTPCSFGLHRNLHNSSCVVGIYVLEVVASSLFISGGTYQFSVRVRAPLKIGNRSCRDKAWGSSQISVGGGSLVVVENSSLHVAWVFLVAVCW